MAPQNPSIGIIHVTTVNNINGKRKPNESSNKLVPKENFDKNMALFRVCCRALIFKTTGVYLFQRKSGNSRRIVKWAIPETSGHTRLIRQSHMQQVDDLANQSTIPFGDV